MISLEGITNVFAEWFKDDLIRPVLILVCAMLLFNLPTVLYKIRMTLRGVMYFLFCWDKSWKKPQDPGAIFGPHLSQGLPVERKTIYFVRHGESTWNDTFNKGHRTTGVFLLGFIPGLIKALLYELYLLLSGKLDRYENMSLHFLSSHVSFRRESEQIILLFIFWIRPFSWFYDSPLSHLGLSQTEELSAFLRSRPTDGVEGEHLKILRGDPDAPPSKMVCSSLRRAVSTVAGGFRDRLSRRPDDKIMIIDSLQEVSRNPDTLAITPPHTQIQASWIERSSKMCDFQEIFDSQTDMSLYTGNKPLNTNGLKRMQDFCEFVYSPSVKENNVIVGGHSIWFRSFFNMFLPYSVHHVSKNKKIVNGGIVTFELMKADTRRGPKYMIDPKTIKVVYGGF